MIMDPIETIHPKKDSTLALMLEAQRRHMEIFYLTIDKIYLNNQQVMCQAVQVRVQDSENHFYQFMSSEQSYSLNEFEFVLMRKDPPFDKRFLYTTYLLDIAKQKGAFIINDPTSIRNANEKMFATWFSSCCPETLVTSKIKLILDFLSIHQKIIIKPLGERGGHGVLLLSLNDLNNDSSLELLTKNETLAIMAQRFIPEILSTGDKRLLMIDGEPFPYSVIRIPKSGDFRGNISAGAHTIVEPINDSDRLIAKEVGPLLKKMGLYFVGLDLIGNYLTEINVTSPTCIREIDSAFNVNVSEHIFNALEKKISTNTGDNHCV